ncbi:MAG: CTP synthase [Puniceicoccales bacterium]|jgi:CTP synthase|nr:CTP synthase [Puniceicoccales bacterium]
MKLVFVTGGVVSSLGKGLTAASLGALLEEQGLRIGLQKFDPYLNVDPGTMSPFQHGEVYVLKDGAETDLDLGHYERFTNVALSKKHSVSSGQIYASVLKKERQGQYLGNTVQVIPHVTDEIKARILSGANDDTDILITEIGGVVGDIEGLPFLEALRQLALDFGKNNVLFLHVTLIPFLKASSELKTKPSQQSVAKLREIGIQPDILVCRTERPLEKSIRQKLSLFCNVSVESVIEEKDVESSIYELPLSLHEEKLDQLVLAHFGMPYRPSNLNTWRTIMGRICAPKCHVKIGVVGKYVDLRDAYKSIYEALFHAGIANECTVEVKPIDAEWLEQHWADNGLNDLDGILVPGGFGIRGIEGKIMAIRHAREQGMPFLGICLGMQLAVIEFTRHVVNLSDATSTEFDAQATTPVIGLMEEQKGNMHKGASMRLGMLECNIVPHSLLESVYQANTIFERHRHRYEVNKQLCNLWTEKGLKIAGTCRNLDVVEAVELERHPWFVGVQYHPEFQSKPHAAHPLFKSFVQACIKTKNLLG